MGSMGALFRFLKMALMNPTVQGTLHGPNWLKYFLYFPVVMHFFRTGGQHMAVCGLFWAGLSCPKAQRQDQVWKRNTETLRKTPFTCFQRKPKFLTKALNWGVGAQRKHFQGNEKYQRKVPLNKRKEKKPTAVCFPFLSFPKKRPIVNLLVMIPRPSFIAKIN